MKRVLIISPRFPPVNAPDMHRVRHSLRYFEAMGWKPEVWIVDPARVEQDQDPLLLETVPDHIDVHQVSAPDTRWTRMVGLGSLALRSLPFYFWHVSRRLASGEVDLIYFSTTAFPLMILGRYWKQRFKIPYIIDMQDPWHTDFYWDKPSNERPPKFWFSYRLHKYLEPVAMREVDAIISVSEGYCTTLCNRYDNIDQDDCAVIPFGAMEEDFEVMERSDVSQPFVDPSSETVDIVYAGRGGHDMKIAARAIFDALAIGRQECTDLFDPVRMHFLGTSYAPAGRGEKTLEPIAEQCGVGHVVFEQPDRIPYFMALRLLRDADLLVVPGSTDSDYTASKLYPYILARRPVLAVFHEESSVVDILRDTGAGSAVTFGNRPDRRSLARQVQEALKVMLKHLPYTPNTDWNAFDPYTAEAMTRRQVEVFDSVVHPPSHRAEQV